VKSGVENTVLGAWLTLFGQQVEVWLIGGAGDTVIIFNEWSGRWTFNVSSVHISFQGILWSFSWNEDIWLSGGMGFVVFGTCGNTFSLFSVEGGSCGTGNAFS
jgi:hypothetical protein